MQNWEVRKKLYRESWGLKDMKCRLQLLREFVNDKYYIDNATEYLDEALSNIELAMNSKQLKNAYKPQPSEKRRTNNVSIHNRVQKTQPQPKGGIQDSSRKRTCRTP